MNKSKALQQFHQAYALHQNGRFNEAESAYNMALAADPGNPDVLRMHGLLHLQRGNWAEGARLTGASLKSNPNQPEAWNNHGYALQNMGQYEEALASYDQAAKLNPAYAGAWYNRGNVLRDMRRYDDAVTSYQQALAIRPDHADTWVNLGNTFKLMQRYDEARSCYEQAIVLMPGQAVAHNNLGNTLNELERYDDALACFNRAIALNPDYAEAYYNKSLVLQELGRHAEAVAGYRKALAFRPDHAEAHLNLGRSLQKLGKHGEAMSSYDRAIALKPDYADAYASKGSLLVEMGRMAEAETVLSEALEVAPGEIAPLLVLLSLKRCGRDDPLLRQLVLHYADRAVLSVEKRAALSFAMGKAMENIGEYDQAFSAYEEGNRLHHLGHPYDEAEEIRHVENTCSFFSADLFENCRILADTLPPEQDERVPIFIVGMPRSGTTLIEQILASHPALYGAGELPVLGELAKKVELPPIGSPNWEDSLRMLRELGQEYLARVWQLAPEARYITDKMPHNFRNLGLIPLMLPNAKIIHSMRDPMDSCFSCYALKFTDGHEYCYSLETLGRHNLRYRQLMDHWHRVLPGRILDVRYEDTVADLEGQARRLLEYVGLPWDPACLNFYENKRAVSTASVTQVRKPIYSSSVARWKHFEKHLAPLIEIVRSTT
ncbi:MAG: tetratricopeptide repeat protein [Sideroxydans sp.]|nr:tetratricopeptide repeat protein [Sideroxydans sp.]